MTIANLSKKCTSDISLKLSSDLKQTTKILIKLILEKINHFALLCGLKKKKLFKEKRKKNPRVEIS